MVDSETKDFFVSYNSADRVWAEWIAWILEEQGYSVIIQAWDFLPGGNFIWEMQQATIKARRTVMVLSQDYLRASYTQPEWTAAFKDDPKSEDHKLLPIRVAPCDVEGMLGPLIYVDLVGKVEAEAEELVLVAAHQQRTKPVTRPDFPPGVSSALNRSRPDDVIFPGTSAASTERLAPVQESEPLVQPLFKPPSPKLSETDWLKLFSSFSVRDFEGVRNAFLMAFKDLYGDFWKVRSDHPQLSEFIQIQSLLSAYDKPQLAVHFVEHAMVELRRLRGDESRDVSPLELWRDEVAQKFGIALKAPEPVTPGDSQGYLLLALKESGRVTKEGASVTVFSGLHVTGVSSSIEWDASTITCSFDHVAEHLSELIHKAEEVLSPYSCGKITVELFLPCVYLEENVADWEVQNEQQRPRALGKHRGFVVRSLDRVLSRPTQTVLSQNWQLLEDCVEAQNACDQFHLQDTCPEPGDLEVLLEDQPGLKLVADLPEDSEDRQDILYDIINSAVPIALWSSPSCDGTTDERLTEFETLLRASQLTDFANLAQQWRQRRVQARNMTAKQLRLLCDCPDRWPKLPDKRREDDLLVAS